MDRQVEDFGYLISVALYIRGDALDPAHVTKMLDVQPTDSRAKGDKHGREGKYTARNGFWVVKLEAKVATFRECIDAVSRLVDDLIDLLRPCPDDFASQFPGCETFVDVFATGDDGQQHDSRYHFALAAGQLHEISRMGADLRVTIA